MENKMKQASLTCIESPIIGTYSIEFEGNLLDAINMLQESIKVVAAGRRIDILPSTIAGAIYDCLVTEEKENFDRINEAFAQAARELRESLNKKCGRYSSL